MVCKGMKFHRFPLDEHICYLKLTSCKYHIKAPISWIHYVCFILMSTSQHLILRQCKIYTNKIFIWTYQYRIAQYK